MNSTGLRRWTTTSLVSYFFEKNLGFFQELIWSSLLSVHGELILITEDGVEKHLKNPGDTVVQKGTLHAWRNPSKVWARWVTVLIAADPAIVRGEALDPVFKPFIPN